MGNFRKVEGKRWPKTKQNKTWRREAKKEGVTLNKTAQKKNGRRTNRMYEETRNIWLIYQKPVKHKVIQLQTH